MHTSRPIYQANVSRGGKRYQLDAKEGGEVNAEQVEHAQKSMKA